MKYQVELKAKAEKDLKSLQKGDFAKVAERLQLLESDMQGDVKRLSNHSPEYRMRAGNYRALFEVVGGRIIVYRILHRKDAYR